MLLFPFRHHWDEMGWASKATKLILWSACGSETKVKILGSFEPQISSLRHLHPVAIVAGCQDPLAETIAFEAGKTSEPCKNHRGNLGKPAKTSGNHSQLGKKRGSTCKQREIETYWKHGALYDIVENYMEKQNRCRASVLDFSSILRC